MIRNKMRKASRALTAACLVVAAAALSACSSMINDDLRPCTARYLVPITFTHNILDADAFPSQVTGVTLYVFDANGNLALRKTDSGAALSKPGYMMEVELPAGTYSMLAWCTGDAADSNPTAFAIGGGERPTAMSQLSASLPLQGTAPELFSDRDIVPLFYGTASGAVCRPGDDGDVILPTVDLMKDTNVLQIVLQNADTQAEMDPQEFRVEVSGTNSQINYLNEVVGSTAFTYLPWSVQSLATENDAAQNTASRAATVNSGMMTETTMGRLMIDREPRLKVVRTTDDVTIIDLNLTKYLCMVKGHYQAHWSDQEYLDRMDQHTIVFFIDANRTWYTAMGININGWRIVPPQDQDL